MSKSRSRDNFEQARSLPVKPAGGFFPPPPGYFRPRGYPPINLPPVKPYPPDPYIDQFSLPEALCVGTLFRWLYDPYRNPYCE
jgi:hypothetical protein